MLTFARVNLCAEGCAVFFCGRRRVEQILSHRVDVGLYLFKRVHDIDLTCGLVALQFLILHLLRLLIQLRPLCLSFKNLLLNFNFFILCFIVGDQLCSKITDLINEFDKGCSLPVLTKRAPFISLLA